MSKPVLKRSEYDKAAEAELRRWPGVTLRREKLSKHARAILIFNGQSRVVTYPVTGSDRRGPLNHVGDIRKVLLEMGAKRTRNKPSEAPTRQRNRTEPKHVKLGEKAVKDPSRDPWIVLANLDFPEPAPRGPAPTIPAKPSFWKLLLNIFHPTQKDTSK